jgi:3-dehydroquinate dehydratase II
MTHHILIIHGPNLNLLGTREPHLYGADTLATIEARLQQHFGESAELRFFQSNCEGAIIDAIHSAREWAAGIVINAGAYTHYSLAIRDALSGVELPAVEAHLTNIHARESFRHVSVIADVCIGVVAGFGWRSYLWATEALLAHLHDHGPVSGI